MEHIIRGNLMGLIISDFFKSNVNAENFRGLDKRQGKFSVFLIAAENRGSRRHHIPVIIHP